MSWIKTYAIVFIVLFLAVVSFNYFTNHGDRYTGVSFLDALQGKRTVDVDTVERTVFDLSNQERKSMGLSQMTWSPELASAARAHAIDMAKTGYYDHISPTGSTPQERATNAGFTGRAAENIWAGSAGTELTSKELAQTCFNDIFKSPAHLGTLNGVTNKVMGVGAVSEGGQLWCVQMFGDYL